MRNNLCLYLLLGLTWMPCQAQFVENALADSQAPSVDMPLLEDLLRARSPELRFAADDVISVRVYGVSEYSLQQQVAHDGLVHFPYIGKIQVSGLTVLELEAILEKALASASIILDPQVTVTAISRPSSIVTISGDVAKPGTYPALGNNTLMDYLSQAGGLNNDLHGSAPISSPASSTVTLIRSSLGKPVRIPLGSDPAHSPYGKIPLFPGDEVRVGRMGVVYAVGAFRMQGSFALKSSSSTTVLQLVAMAGGVGYEAEKENVHLIRTAGDKRDVVNLDISKMLKGKAADVNLQAGDIVFLPTNAMKASIKGGGSGILVGLAENLIYALR